MSIAIIGFGEAGRIFAQDLARQGAQVSVWDKKMLSAEADKLRLLAQEMNVSAAPSLRAALEGATLILSLVTASSALSVAQEAARVMTSGQILLDLNSVAPGTKRDAAAAISAGDGRYLDVAVMAPVLPKRLGTPLLLAGDDAVEVAQQLALLGCNAKAVSDTVGDVSAIKMCRSVMIKGMEALTLECLSAAQQYGVHEAVLASLHASFPSIGWNATQPDYLISRVAEHGLRRAEEMKEVVKTLNDAGVSGEMSKATGLIQTTLPSLLAQQKLAYSDLLPFDWKSTLKKLRQDKNR
ncbi:NAD(P)-dependent oxidoreductase [Pantoea vagans]|uniref:NAD(P)-dependent oxidoreductase n=1 Tax=Pantoea vagans TaxID=470934 RepID=UPI00301B2ABA